MQGTTREGVFSPFGVKGYWRLFFGHLICWSFAAIEWMATGWLVLDMTGSAWHVALVDFYRFAPWLLVGLVSGPLIQRFGRKPIILTCQLLYIGCYGSLAVLLWSGHLTYSHIAALACLSTGTMALDFTTRRTMLPSLVGRHRTVDALLLETLVQGSAFTAGPFIGGWLIEVYGMVNVYALVAAMPLISVSLYLGLPDLPSTLKNAGRRESALRTIALGLSYVRHNRVIAGILGITVVMNVFTFPSMSLMPVFARDVLFQGPVGLGLLGAASGVGALIGMPLINVLRRRVSTTYLFAASSGAMSAVVFFFALSTDFPLSLALLVVAGIGQSGFSALQSSVILVEASEEMRDRAMGALLLAIGASPLGRLLIGGIAAAWNTPVAAQICCAAAVVAVAAVMLTVPEYNTWRQRPTEDG
jgi:MFS family permease